MPGIRLVFSAYYLPNVYISGQLRKYHMRIQSIGTARNLYTFFTLEPKDIFGRIQIKIQIKDDGSICNGLKLQNYSVVMANVDIQ